MKQSKSFRFCIDFAMVISIIVFWLLGKGAYHYEYMDSPEKFDETSISPKETFYSELNEEGISDADYAHTQIVWEVFETTNLGEYHVCMFSATHYCLQMFFKTLEIGVMKYADLIPLIFYLGQD